MAALVPQLEAAPLAFVAAAGGPPLPDVLSQARQQLLDACKPSSKPVLLIIGPEGDLTGIVKFRLHAFLASRIWPISSAQLAPVCTLASEI